MPNIESRIPLDQFTNYDRCILSGSLTGIRYSAAMEAFEDARITRKAEQQSNRLTPRTWQDVYIVR